MGEELFSVIRSVGIFIVCAQTITHFRPHGSYEKYLKLLVSVMVLVQIVVPLFHLFDGASEQEFGAIMEQYEGILEGTSQQVNAAAGKAEGLLQEYTLQEVEDRMEAEAKVEVGTVVIEEVEVGR